MEKKELSRTKLHENAMICLYQYLFYHSEEITFKKDLEEIVTDVMEMPYNECDDFFKAIIFETIKDRKEFTDIISENLSKKWSFNRLSMVEQSILLLFTSEILNKRVESQVGINEAIELAKLYCDDNAYKYINAVLDKISKEYA